MKKTFLTLTALATLLISCTNKKVEVMPTKDTVKAADSMSIDSVTVDSTQVDSN
jgi:hypothetical protein